MADLLMFMCLRFGLESLPSTPEVLSKVIPVIMGGAQVQSLNPTPRKHFGPLKGGGGGAGRAGGGGGQKHQPLPRSRAELRGRDLQ